MGPAPANGWRSPAPTTGMNTTTTRTPTSRLRTSRISEAGEALVGGTHGIRFQGQWQGGALGCSLAHAAVVGDPGGARAHRHQIRLRDRTVRRLHGPYRRQTRLLV